MTREELERDCLKFHEYLEKAVPGKSVRLQMAECNWTCARASTCHEYECDGDSHFVAKATPNVENTKKG